MGWYHDVGFNWDNDGAPPAACPIRRSANEQPAAPAPAPAPAASGNTACPLPPTSPPPPPPPDVECIYHLCQKVKWDEAQTQKLPYFPPTYMSDGKFTRATVYKEDLVSTANTYYKDTQGEFLVLEINCQVLYALGIPILAEDAPESTPKQPVKCLQVFGGISTTLPGLIKNIYTMNRDSSSGTFLSLGEVVTAKKNSVAAEEKKDDANEVIVSSKKEEKPSRSFWPRMKR